MRIYSYFAQNYYPGDVHVRSSPINTLDVGALKVHPRNSKAYLATVKLIDFAKVSGEFLVDGMNESRFRVELDDNLNFVRFRN